MDDMNSQPDELNERFEAGEELSELELLELLLSSVKPAKRARERAELLLKRYKSFDQVFRANIFDLEENDKIGKHAAILIKIIKTVGDRRDFTLPPPSFRFDSDDKLCELFYKRLYGMSEERIVIAAFDSKYRMIGAKYSAGQTSTHCVITPREIADFIVRSRAKCFAIAHNHPDTEKETLEPSGKDIETTASFLILANDMKVKFLGHFLVNDYAAMRISER